MLHGFGTTQVSVLENCPFRFTEFNCICTRHSNTKTNPRKPEKHKTKDKRFIFFICCELTLARDLASKLHSKASSTIIGIMQLPSILKSYVSCFSIRLLRLIFIFSFYITVILSIFVDKTINAIARVYSLVTLKERLQKWYTNYIVCFANYYKRY